MRKRQYLAKVTGLSRAQLARLIDQFAKHDAIRDRRGQPRRRRVLNERRASIARPFFVYACPKATAKMAGANASVDQQNLPR